jgi:RHS repeat-associated protein
MTQRLLTLLIACSLLAPSLTHAQRVEYYHVDALGSVRAVTDEQGEVLERHDYLPFGEEWNPRPSGQPRKFTGKERDQETGWDYFGARYYEASLARFTSIDPVTNLTASAQNPQLWNRYSYSLNNPLRFVDPDGKFPWVVPIFAAAGLAVLMSPDVANAPGPNDPTFESNNVGAVFPWAATGVAFFKELFPEDQLEPETPSFHGNDRRSNRPQHMYEIDDKEVGEVMKTGISGRPLNKNGTSPRANRQVNDLNRHYGSDRFDSRVVEKDIPGRQKALELEKVNTTRLTQEGHTLPLQRRPKP